jgi:hypothetical protein
MNDGLGGCQTANVFDDVALFFLDEETHDILELLEFAAVQIGIDLQFLVEEKDELLGIVILVENFLSQVGLLGLSVFL